MAGTSGGPTNTSCLIDPLHFNNGWHVVTAHSRSMHILLQSLLRGGGLYLGQAVPHATELYEVPEIQHLGSGIRYKVACSLSTYLS